MITGSRSSEWTIHHIWSSFWSLSLSRSCQSDQSHSSSSIGCCCHSSRTDDAISQLVHIHYYLEGTVRVPTMIVLSIYNLNQWTKYISVEPPPPPPPVPMDVGSPQRFQPVVSLFLFILVWRYWIVANVWYWVMVIISASSSLRWCQWFVQWSSRSSTTLTYGWYLWTDFVYL